MRLALVAGLLAMLPMAAQAQRKARSRVSRNSKGVVKSVTVQNLPAYDERWFHPGMYLSFSGSKFNLEQSDYYVANKWVTANSIISPSLGVGFLGDARLGGPGSPFILRFAPGVSFLTRRVEFGPRGYAFPDSIVTQNITSTIVQFPILVKYQSDRRRNSRLYMIAGLNPTLTASNRRNDPLHNVLHAETSDLTLEYGVGLELFYPLFKLAPELRFSHGLRNLLVDHNDVLSRSLQRFLDRRGQGLFALMLEAPDPDAEAQRLSARGFQVLPRMPGAGGRDIHPHSTLGVLIRIYPVDSFRGKPPLGRPAGPLSGVMRVLIAVRDLDLARAIYGTGLGLATDPPVRDAAGGLAIVRVHPPSGGSIDLVAVRDATRPLAATIERHLAAHGEGMYGLVLQADDPTALLAPLRTAGLEARLAADDPKVVEITRDSPFGALIRIEPASRRCGP